MFNMYLVCNIDRVDNVNCFDRDDYGWNNTSEWR
jgi:hypothetical protein